MKKKVFRERYKIDIKDTEVKKGDAVYVIPNDTIIIKPKRRKKSDK